MGHSGMSEDVRCSMCLSSCACAGLSFTPGCKHPAPPYYPVQEDRATGLATQEMASEVLAEPSPASLGHNTSVLSSGSTASSQAARGPHTSVRKAHCPEGAGRALALTLARTLPAC